MDMSARAPCSGRSRGWNDCGLIQPIVTGEGRPAYRLAQPLHADQVAQTEGV